MADPPGSLQEIIWQRQQAGFVGREAQLAFFRDNLALPADDERRRFLFAIHGDGGIGKTFLVSRLSKAVGERGWLTAVADDAAYDVLEVMAAIAGQLDQQGGRLKRFEQRYAAYRKRSRELGAGASAGVDAASLLTQAAVKAGLGAARSLPLGGVVTEFIDPKATAQGTDQLRAAVMKKMRNRDDMRLLLSPVDELTPAFVEGLRQHGRPVALFFDAYERTAAFLDDWLRNLFDGAHGPLPTDLVIAVAGRDPLDASRWSAYLPFVADIPLAPFSDVEARQLLAQEGVTDEHTVTVILNASGGLPLAVAMLAEARPSGGQAPGDVSASVVERFLQWEDDPARRETALVAALPRRLDQDVITVLAGPSDAAELYDWLARQPFVTSAEGRCHYHEVVREPMIRLNRGRSPQRWRELHGKLAEANQQWREQLGIADEDGWEDPLWQGYLTEEIYHRLCADSANSLPDALGLAVDACLNGATVARKWADMLAQAGHDADATVLAELGKRFEDALSAEQGAEIRFLDVILRERRLSTAARANAYRVRGRQHRIEERYEQALQDFDRAIALNPRYGGAFAGRGETCRLMGRDEEALASLSQAIELDLADDWSFVSRGETYWALGRYEEALADYSRAIELDPEYAWAIASRGQTYRALGRYEEALADYSRAIELDPDTDYYLADRGETYRALGRHEEALADYSRAIELDPDTDYYLADRGETYRALGRHEEALADYSRAIELDPEYAWAIASRGQTYRALGRHEEALADYSRAIELDPDTDYYLAGRGETYRALGRHEEALADYSRAIELDPEYAWAIASRGQTYRALGRHEEALADYSRAIELDPDTDYYLADRGETYRALGRHEEALADYSRAIELDPEYAWAIASRGQTYRALGRHEEALADYSRAIELDPEMPWTFAERGRIHRRVGHQTEAEADFDRAVALDPEDEDLLMERAMVRAVEHHGKDHFQCIVDLDATASDSALLASMITDWLVSAGVIEPERTDSAPGHAPGHSWSKSVSGASPAGDTSSGPRRVGVIARRGFCHPLVLDAVTCPSCGVRIDVRQAGQLTAAWDRVIDAATLWQDGGDGILRCPNCVSGAHLRDWQFDPTWAFGHLFLVFLNWPPLAERFTSDVSHQLAHRIAVIAGEQ